MYLLILLKLSFGLNPIWLLMWHMISDVVMMWHNLTRKGHGWLHLFDFHLCVNFEFILNLLSKFENNNSEYLFTRKKQIRLKSTSLSYSQPSYLFVILYPSFTQFISCIIHKPYLCAARPSWLHRVLLNHHRPQVPTLSAA